MTRFRKNHAFEREMAAEPGLVAFVRETSTATAVAVREAAPTHTGYYKRRVVPVGDRIFARDPFWHLVEYGSVNNPPYAPLRRGVLAAGLRLDENLK